jgi:hypothetical protein
MNRANLNDFAIPAQTRRLQIEVDVNLIHVWLTEKNVIMRIIIKMFNSILSLHFQTLKISLKVVANLKPKVIFTKISFKKLKNSPN